MTDTTSTAEQQLEITLRVNGVARTATAPARRLLSDFLRHELRLTGTHVGCEHGVCGACTVLVDGKPIRGCIALAVSLDGAEVRTLEGMQGDKLMETLKAAFHEKHGLQCGFCTPGMLISAWDLLQRRRDLDERAVRTAMSGNLCRCTGYQGIVRSILAADEARGKEDAP